MTKYSHSRIGIYENCPLQYRFKYIDRVEAPFEENDSTFLGSMCHETLERLYKDKVGGKTDTREEVLEYFDRRWKEEYDPDAILHSGDDRTGDYYRRLGLGWIGRYYDDFFVGDRMEILGIETDDVLDLPDGNQYYIRIDKLGYLDGTYYVCDYKTDSRAKDQSVADADRQLAMYALWVKRTFPDAERVRLLWQMLRFTGDRAQVVSERTAEQLEDLEKAVVDTIAEIEGTTEFLPSDTAYCDYCVYKGMCPRFAPPKVLDLEDTTVLVDEYVRNNAGIRTLEQRNDEIKKELSAVLSGSGCDLVSGTEKDLSASVNRQVVYSDREAVERIVEEKGLTARYSSFNIRSVSNDVLKGTADPEIMALARITEGYTFRERKKKQRKEEE
ncbi:MAG: PD-(D/E)XK nuclease family protein [archaeon]|nr:PD-(D/E)XK nuclease family protein [archaeon]